TSDYYALAGILRSTDVIVHENVSRWTTRKLPMTPEQKQAHIHNQKTLAAVKKRLSEVKKEKPLEKDSIKRLEAEIKRIKALDPRSETMAVSDAKLIADCEICVRG